MAADGGGCLLCRSATLQRFAPPTASCQLPTQCGASHPSRACRIWLLRSNKPQSSSNQPMISSAFAPLISLPADNQIMHPARTTDPNPPSKRRHDRWQRTVRAATGCCQPQRPVAVGKAASRRLTRSRASTPHQRHSAPPCHADGLLRTLSRLASCQETEAQCVLVVWSRPRAGAVTD